MVSMYPNATTMKVLMRTNKKKCITLPQITALSIPCNFSGTFSFLDLVSDTIQLFPNLTALCVGVVDEFVAEAINNLPHLKLLHVTPYTDNVEGINWEMKSLETLILRQHTEKMKYQGQLIKLADFARGCQKLKTLFHYGDNQTKDEFLSALQQHNTCLQTAHITEGCKLAHLQTYRTLSTLSFDYNERSWEEDFKSISKLKELKALHIVIRYGNSRVKEVCEEAMQTIKLPLLQTMVLQFSLDLDTCLPAELPSLPTMCIHSPMLQNVFIFAEKSGQKWQRYGIDTFRKTQNLTEADEDTCTLYHGELSVNFPMWMNSYV